MGFIFLTLSINWDKTQFPNTKQLQVHVWPELQWFIQELVCRIKLHRHAQPAVDHVIVAVLSAIRLVSDLKARRTVDCSVNPRHLRGESNPKRGISNINVPINTSSSVYYKWLSRIKKKQISILAANLKGNKNNVCTSISGWSSGTLKKVGRRLLNHMVTSLFMLTAKGSKPSCRPHMV